MKRSDLTIVLSVVGVGLIAAFWFLVLSPKRQESSDLSAQVAELEAAVQKQEQLAADARAAEQDFPRNYHRLVVLGKGVPADADTPSLLVQVQRLADDADVQFEAIKLAQTATTEAAPTAPPPLVAPGTDTSGDGSSQPAEGEAAATDGSTTAATTTAVPTEAAAALLPLGASIGPAGLGTMPYEVHFRGDYFEIADFLDRLASLVHPGSDGVRLRGRLLTVNGFSLGPDSAKGFPHLEGSLAITTFVTPGTQGLTAGATPAGPAPATDSAATPAATPTSSATSTPTATTSP